jgi:SnoaL-like domain
MSPQALLKRFYAAFATLDARTMQGCYAPRAQFEDPLFALDGAEQIGAMWQMVCQTIRNGGQAVWRLETREVEAAGGERGSAHWEARYRSGAAGRMVHNVVEAQFTFEDGLIAMHSENYDFWRWSRQALGPTGLMMGWSPMLRNQVRRQAQGKLERFLAHRASLTPRASA